MDHDSQTDAPTVASPVPDPPAAVDLPDAQDAQDAPDFRRPRRWLTAGIILILSGLAVAAIDYGVRIRPQIYWATDGLHWGDAYNAYLYGRGANHYGVFHFYDVVLDAQARGISRLAGDTPTVMDYPPLRLVVVTIWAHWGMQNLPTEDIGYDGRANPLLIPMLQVNMVSELISSIFVFLLIWIWVRRMARSDAVRSDAVTLLNGESTASLHHRITASPSNWTGLFPAFIGALLLWFSPGLLWNSYAFPQWDTWIITFFLGALLLASVEWWFAAGAMIAIGTLLKGQMLIVAPLFILWPLFQLRWQAPLRWLCGFAITFAAIVLPFMQPQTSAMIHLLLSIAAMGLAIPYVFRWQLGYRWLIGLGAASLLLAWPWGSQASFGMRFISLTTIGFVWLLRFVPPRIVPHLVSLVMAVVIFLMLPLYDLSDAWYQVGFKYGTEKFPVVATQGTNNLAAILVRYFQVGASGRSVEGNSHATIDVWWLGTMEVRTLFMGIYAICLVLCSFAAAMHARRNDTRFLLACIAPWICSFAVLPQLNNRYLVWAAGMSALLPAVGVGMTLLGILVSLLAWEGVAQLMYAKFEPGSQIARYLNPPQTHLGWILVLAAAIYLYVALMPRQRPRLRARPA